MKGEGSPSAWKVNSASKTRETEKEGSSGKYGGIQGVLIVTLISFCTTRTFNHQTSCTQLWWSSSWNTVDICSLSTNCAVEQGWAQAAVGSIIFQKQGQQWGPLALQVPARWASADDCDGARLSRASWDLSRGCQILLAILSALPLSLLSRPQCHWGCGWILSALYRKRSCLGYCSMNYWVFYLEGRSWHWKRALEEEEDLPWTLLKAVW